MTDKMRCCANCEHWYPYNEDELDKKNAIVEGECRRYPPNIPVFDNTTEDMCDIKDLILCLTKGVVFVNYPFVFAEEWCGEFKLMKNPRWTKEGE